MKQTHYNRILEVISNSENTSKHLPAIRKMIENFEMMFPLEWADIYVLAAHF